MIGFGLYRFRGAKPGQNCVGVCGGKGARKRRGENGCKSAKLVIRECQKLGPKGVPKGGPKGLPKGGVEGSNQHAFCLSQQDPHSRAPQLNDGVDDGVDTGAEMASSKTRGGETFHSNKNNKEL